MHRRVGANVERGRTLGMGEEDIATIAGRKLGRSRCIGTLTLPLGRRLTIECRHFEVGLAVSVQEGRRVAQGRLSSQTERLCSMGCGLGRP